MVLLFIVSFVWAFSFGLIKGNLTGIDSNLVAFIRMSISTIIFLPLFRYRNISFKKASTLFFIGLIQFGLMYISYIKAFQFLEAHQVALFTIFTPIYITILNDILKKCLNLKFQLNAALAVIGTSVIVYSNIGDSSFLTGFFIIQLSNISFAAGQVFYKRVTRNSKTDDKNVYFILYAGALFITGLASLITVDYAQISISTKQWLTLLYLGILPSGICFFLWNVGVKYTNLGAVAVMNNLKIPLAVICSIVFFHESSDYIRLAIGTFIIIASLLINKYYKTNSVVKQT
ncbi:MAG: EamA family transporter [Candidatus Cloacimonetes bacterium]|nr:EamA family transporter [Candidatus Cloacimonadota bacterium]